MTKTPPVILTLAGHDPIGGAGIQADLEAIRANGGWGASALSCLTVQDTRGVTQVQATDTELFKAQAQAVLADLPVQTLKTGALATADQVAATALLAAQNRHCALIVDPVLAGGGGGSLGGTSLAQALMRELIPLASLVTPNTVEAERLTGFSDPEQAAQALLQAGARAVLITGTHAPTKAITHRLYEHSGSSTSFDNPRLPGEFHGSGCTLAAAIAARLPQDGTLDLAVKNALNYCFSALSHAQALGHGQHLPDRLWRLKNA